MATVKTAVSVEKPLFDRVEEMARERGVPRSRVFNLALRSFFSQHDERELVARINAACNEPPDPEEEKRLSAMSHSFRHLVEGQW
ncbi:MAG: hypothetical protein FJ290_01865 [Planctomycetes bacterium]|nr:hypothetical protein [Planctomycetota bacterium]